MYLSLGNKKLAPNDRTKFLIWNLPADITCPFSTPLCRRFCYAKKAERMYKSVRESRAVNLEDSKRDDFIPRMIAEISKNVNRKTWQHKRVLFRIHESGDFYSVEYAKAWLEIATVFPKVQFLAYTKSLAFFSGLSFPPNFVLRASVWDDTPTEELLRIQSKAYPTYTALPKEELEKANCVICDCKKSCALCGLCWYNNNVNIATEIH